MATTTRLSDVGEMPSINVATQASTDPGNDSENFMAANEGASSSGLEEAVTKLAESMKIALNTLRSNPAFQEFDPTNPLSANDILSMPISALRIDDSLFKNMPPRKPGRNGSELVGRVAQMLYPCPTESKAPLIRYSNDRVRLRSWIAVQRKFDALNASDCHRFGINGDGADNEYSSELGRRILDQGPWDCSKFEISTKGVQAIPMPVVVATAESLESFFDHLQRGGDHEVMEGGAGKNLEDGKGEPGYGTKGVEYQKGVVYEDGRMDLCKMVVGPDHIGKLMESLKPNEFIRHFLLGNNIIGPVGAEAIADFVSELPDRMDTWYLAGNCIDGYGFKRLVDALVKSEAVTNIWLKRNPLGSGAASDVYRLITETPNLRTLDLDQTELGDQGVAQVFNLLAAYKTSHGRKLPLKHLYLNGSGLSTAACEAIGKFLTSPASGLTSLYISHNPIADSGSLALSAHLPQARTLERLSLMSVAISSIGAMAILKSLKHHPAIRMLDLGQAYQTVDLGQAYNWIDEEAVPAIEEFLASNKTIEYFNLGQTAIMPVTLRSIALAVSQSSSLVYYAAQSIYTETSVPAPRFVPVHDSFTEQSAWSALLRQERDAQQQVRKSLEANVQAKYGRDMSYRDFLRKEKRFLVNDRDDIRKIDSVYRNRDAGMARRGLMKLLKEWEKDDDTLAQVMAAQGPVCCTRRRK